MPSILTGRQPRRAGCRRSPTTRAASSRCSGRRITSGARAGDASLPGQVLPGPSVGLRPRAPVSADCSATSRINYLHGSLPADSAAISSPPARRAGARSSRTRAAASLEFVESVDKRSNPEQDALLSPHHPAARSLGRLPSGRRYGDATWSPGCGTTGRLAKARAWRRRAMAGRSGPPAVPPRGRTRGPTRRRRLDRLDETGLYDRALIIVTADHGVSFRPGGRRRRATVSNLADSRRCRCSSSTPARRGEDGPASSVGDRRSPDDRRRPRIRVRWAIDGRSFAATPSREGQARPTRREPVVVAAPRRTQRPCWPRERRGRWRSSGRETESTVRGRAETRLSDARSPAVHLLRPWDADSSSAESPSWQRSRSRRATCR